LLYGLLAGADFGAGILEAFLGKNHREEQREVVTHAIGPVWEANHMWLILAVVILFVGYPKAYTQASVALHIPLTIMLIGIVLRGCAFTFRHYDAVKDDSQRWYSALFVTSSFLAPFFLGTVAGAVFLGRISLLPPSNFAEAYVAPWANWFSFSVGAFTCALFAFLAAVYLIGETADFKIQSIFVKRAKWANFLAIVSGIAVFAGAEIDGLNLVEKFWSDPFSLACMILATLSLAPLWSCIRAHRVQTSRILVASQVGLILLGWFKLQFPALIILSPADGALNIYNSAAPEATMRFLLYALLAGSALIFPALIYLLIVFKAGAPHREA
jgi:cytochrome d ubiquinol oxidase subunit II